MPLPRSLVGASLALLIGCGDGASQRPRSPTPPAGLADASTSDRPDARVEPEDAGRGDLAGWGPDAAPPDLSPPDLSAPDLSVPPSCTGPGCGPRILSLSANVTTLRSHQTLIVSAVVSDPDGIDDLIGGTLSDPDSGATYGAFQTSASEGAYSLSLSWAELDTVRGIDAPASGVRRVFLARFFDEAGNASQEQLEVLLRCELDTHAACSGTCVNLETNDQHCGRCNNAVPSGASCERGVPACYSSSHSICGGECVNLSYSTDHCGECGHACPYYPGRSVSCWEGGVCSLLDSRSTAVSCNSVCTPHGYVCGWTQWVYGSGSDSTATIGTCAAVPPSTDGQGRSLTAVNCGCRHYPSSSSCTPGPEETVAACTDGCSNDGDRYIDCEDFDCCDVVSCPAGTACGDR